jgi:uncharacterized protein (DUF1778 family)
MALQSNASTRAARIEARIAPEVLSSVKRAAEITGRSVSDFVVTAARDMAERTIEQAHIIRLSMADQERVSDLLANPPATNKALKKAFAAHRKLIIDSQ